MVRVYEVDGLDGVDKSKETSGFYGHQRIKGYNGQRASATNWRKLNIVKLARLCKNW